MVAIQLTDLVTLLGTLRRASTALSDVPVRYSHPEDIDRIEQLISTLQNHLKINHKWQILLYDGSILVDGLPSYQMAREHVIVDKLENMCTLDGTPVYINMYIEYEETGVC